MVLGTREILKLAISISYQQALLEGTERDEFFREWRLIVWSAVAAGMLGGIMCPGQADTAYLCCLLKDTSLLFLRCSAPEELPKLSATRPLTAFKPGQLQAEEEAWGMSHGALSHFVLAKMGGPFGRLRVHPPPP